MQITLLAVRQSLAREFGIESFAVGMIRDVKEAPADDPIIQTAAMDENGVFWYNKGWIDKYVSTPEDLFCICAHEFLHLAYNHFLIKATPHSIEAVAIDAIINATIVQLWPNGSGGGSLMKKTFQKKRLPDVVLRPEADYKSTVASKLYEALYGLSKSEADNVMYGRRQKSSDEGKQKLTSLEVINILKTIIPPEMITKVTLWGNHGQGQGEGEGGEGEDVGSGIKMKMSQKTVDRLLTELKRQVQKAMKGGKGAGFSMDLAGELIAIINSRLSIKRQLMQRYAASSLLSKFLAPTEETERQESPILITPSRRDLINLINLEHVHTFHNLEDIMEMEMSKGTAVYIDVSGSVANHIGDIMAILIRAKSQIAQLYQFSNVVREIEIRRVRDAVQVETTWGTDFDCVAESIITDKHPKAVIFTDGIANMSREWQHELDEMGLECLTILYSDHQNKEHPFNRWGESMDIKEATDTYKYA